MKSNVYLHVPLSRVIADAGNGVALAMRALAVRDPRRARLMGIGISAEQQRKGFKKK